ncbi:uncharacterized protein LOC134244842 [Saccostrea cucullata]|uniref:uncharacterized protein LOC134244842 n=1 Tax=Saccostrea cuccullata TaxID=36930 RepID=UPI002ED4B467
MKNRMDDIQIGKITKKKMWTEISESLISKGFKFTGDQVMGKWKTLISALKRTKDNNRKSGSGKKTCPFQEELEEILDGNPSINPIATTSTTIEKNICSGILSSSSGTPSSSSGTASSSLGTPSSSSGTLSAPSSSSGTLSSSSGTLSSSSGTPSSSSGTPSSSSGTPSSRTSSKRKGDEQITKCDENNNVDPTRADRKKTQSGFFK